MDFSAPQLKSNVRKSFALFSTAPQSAHFVDGEKYLGRLAEVARWSEASGCKGILVYSDNSLIDPWLAAQVVVMSTLRLSPLVAIQPVYMHPYSAAKIVASLSYLHHRNICLNMIAGGFRNDLQALSDPTEHDERYERLKEYTLVIKGLLSSPRPFSFSGRFYSVKDLAMRPVLPRELNPEIYISGSSDAGLAAARYLDAITVEYPTPEENYIDSSSRNRGLRIGILCAPDADQAWQIAHSRFPGDKSGQIKHLLAMKVTDSHWHKQLSGIESQAKERPGVYWLWPFKNYSTFCPYLVGDYEQVSDELLKYMRAGFDTFILDIPVNEADLQHACIVLDMAADKLSHDDEIPSSTNVSALNARAMDATKP